MSRIFVLESRKDCHVEHLDINAKWKSQAACVVQHNIDGKELDAKERVEIFYPQKFNAVNVSNEELRAKLICRSCPVKSECLEYAILNREYGIWGGMTQRERRTEVRRRIRISQQ